MFKRNNEKLSADCGGSAAGAQQFEDDRALKANLDKIKHKLIVLSGKGGVGKSTVAVNIAISLAKKGHRVGLLDIDIHGPSIPKMLGLEGARPGSDGVGLIPVEYSPNLKTISIGFLLGNTEEAVIWRGPMKYGAIKQFLKDVTWGELDYLVVDSPPGTGDEPLSICQLIENPSGAVVVTTPQDVALTDVRRSIRFCKNLNMPVNGVVENMSGFVCPHCGEGVDIFKKGGGKIMADEMGVPFLGSIPIEIGIMEDGDSGRPFTESQDMDKKGSITAFEEIVNNITKNIGD